jgi:hypothetical protein
LGAPDDYGHGAIPAMIQPEDIAQAVEGERFIIIRIEAGYWDGFSPKPRLSAKYFAYIRGRLENYGGRQE